MREIDQSKYWINEKTRSFMSKGYLKKDQTVENRIDEICANFEILMNSMGDHNQENLKNRLKHIIEMGWVSLSSPIWSNYGTEKGLPISCNNSVMSDSVESILEKTAEVGVMTKLGSGTSVYIGDLRPKGSPISAGGYSYGPNHFMPILEETVNIVSQGNVRRGNCAIYQDVEHPDINDFLEFREEGSPIQHLSLGVMIGDEWMNEMIGGNADKRKTWGRIIRKRFETGYPYIGFRDTVNQDCPEYYKGKIKSSNLCNEIWELSDSENSFVCCLSSMNILHYEKWKNTDAVQVVTWFLDTVMEEYIRKTTDMKFMKAAHKFAKEHRALGLGQLGYHSFLQEQMLPFSSQRAHDYNLEIAKYLNDETMTATKDLAKWFGSPDFIINTGMRNATRLAIAPTTSSSMILGQVSPSIEPLADNYFIKDLAKGKYTFKNPKLKEILENRGKNNDDVWKSILVKGGSVQHLTFLSDHEKEVFKTFDEISQMDVVTQAAVRQQYIDQGQSLNIKIHPETPAKEVSDLLIAGWRMGIKGFYYHIGSNLAQEKSRESITECSVCEA